MTDTNPHHVKRLVSLTIQAHHCYRFLRRYGALRHISSDDLAEFESLLDRSLKPARLIQPTLKPKRQPKKY